MCRDRLLRFGLQMEIWVVKSRSSKGFAEPFPSQTAFDRVHDQARDRRVARSPHFGSPKQVSPDLGFVIPAPRPFELALQKR
jgi:hypothetical protein